MKTLWSLLFLVSFLVTAASCCSSACSRQAGVSQPIQLTDETVIDQTDSIESESGPG